VRTLLAALLCLTSTLALTSTADARKAKRGPGPSYYYPPPAYYVPPSYNAPSPNALNERLVCEERARAADPSGQYAGYPCWAREAFGRGGAGGRGR
jgi:hypothetical protein